MFYDDPSLTFELYDRPKWNANTTATELDLDERESFLDWRKKLAEFVPFNTD